MKKKFIIAAFLLSFSIFASEDGSDRIIGPVDNFLSILPLGTHNGVDEIGSQCSVIVEEVNYPEKVISVSVLNGNHRIFKTIKEDSEFFIRLGSKEFIQSDRFFVDDTRSSYVDRIVRTALADDNKLFVIVANEVTINRERFVDALSCLVKF